MENKEIPFAFGKKIGINDQCLGIDISLFLNIIGKLLVCMKETNKHHNIDCEFFRLDFRQPYFDEELQFPRGALILDMKWGHKDDVEKNKCAQSDGEF